jgi:hypothetical protein
MMNEFQFDWTPINLEGALSKFPKTVSSFKACRARLSRRGEWKAITIF